MSYNTGLVVVNSVSFSLSGMLFDLSFGSCSNSVPSGGYNGYKSRSILYTHNPPGRENHENVVFKSTLHQRWGRWKGNSYPTFQLHSSNI